jgi:negative regulator of sigma E activity
MTDKSAETVSALLDGYLDEWAAGRAIDAILQDSELRGQWARYHLIADVLHNNLTDPQATQLADRVAVALRTEPTVLAPPRYGKAARVAKQVTGIAVAASVATLAIIGFQSLRGGLPGEPERPPSTAAASAESIAIDEPHLVAQRGYMGPALSNYLLNHSEEAALTDVRGMLPYARIVAYEPAGNAGQ